MPKDSASGVQWGKIIASKDNKPDRESNPRNLTWHRVGWKKKTEALKAGRAESEFQRARSVLEAPIAPKDYKGPVYLRSHSHTFTSSRNVQHTHRTTLLQAYCPGLRGAPPAEPNTAFYSELDDQLLRIRRTCSDLHAKNVALATSTPGSPGAARAPADDRSTMAMREKVNESFEEQLHFFTQCVARNCDDGAYGRFESRAAVPYGGGGGALAQERYISPASPAGGFLAPPAAATLRYY